MAAVRVPKQPSAPPPAWLLQGKSGLETTPTIPTKVLHAESEDEGRKQNGLETTRTIPTKVLHAESEDEGRKKMV